MTFGRLKCRQPSGLGNHQIYQKLHGRCVHPCAPYVGQECPTPFSPLNPAQATEYQLSEVHHAASLPPAHERIIVRPTLGGDGEIGHFRAYQALRG
jgi:hypothetical protein